MRKHFILNQLHYSTGSTQNSEPENPAELPDVPAASTAIPVNESAEVGYVPKS